jgi:hypothetical protein
MALSKFGVMIGMFLFHAFLTQSWPAAAADQKPATEDKTANAFSTPKLSGKEKFDEFEGVKFLSPAKMQWSFEDHGTTVPPFWKIVSGQWKIASDPEHPANRVLHQQEASRDYQYLVSDQKFINFAFSIRLRTDMEQYKTRNWQMGMIFRSQHRNQYYKLRVTAANIALTRVSHIQAGVLPSENQAASTASTQSDKAGSDEQVLLILPFGITTQTWHTLGVVCNGQKISIRLNGREIRTVSDQVLGLGRIGVYTFKTSGFFDDLKILYLPTPEIKKGITSDRRIFNPGRNEEMAFYFYNPRSGPLEIRLFNSSRRLVGFLAKGAAAEGVGSIVWDGQSSTNQVLQPGTYTVELSIDKQRFSTEVGLSP